MDALLSEINNKRKDLQDPVVGSDRPNKYMRKGEIERAKEQDERKRRAEEDRKKREAARQQREEKEKNTRLGVLRNTTTPTTSSSIINTPPTATATDSTTTTTTTPNKPETFNLPPTECIRRLRAKGAPILLFGETEKDRRLRLRALELLEERGGASAVQAHGNEFKKFLEEAETGLERKEEDRRQRQQPAAAKAKAKSRDVTADPSRTGTPAAHGDDDDDDDDDDDSEDKSPRESTAVPATKHEDEQILDLNLVKTDPRKVYPLIYYALKKVLREWADFLDERPDDIKRSVQGKNAAATQAQTAEYLKPLFKQLRNRALEHDVLRLLAEIIHFMQKREYQAANDAYLRLSIGNAAWPIGVTMVGIHERSAREKIGQDSVAHVLNDEVSRKYIQSVKR
ncbi:hypothetical protein QFC22_000720 [Naganishia vaughanmartiniae]|uniref:Uncharacterized protein n=1 Tax=Naganishia vaughanmartiniae TaxID=1424756 RepID=A0ACC2XKN3_9TREE|nr:hypothetical protein QFC22_000720 [Naganishia vaughanmartiniae]